jgi:hypothetical protein
MRHLVGVIGVVAALMSAGSAQAQSWGVYVGNGAPAPAPMRCAGMTTALIG